MHVICTAGHVDHGKSTLVRALTGMEPDRWAEEIRRGLTIDLGFAWTDIPTESGGTHTVAFVDLPGHERFIANMLAGAGAVRLALFVVAADEGWMPQSREHLDILHLLGVARGVVAVTKADAVDRDTLEIACAMVREELAGSSFADAEIVTVSGATGAGTDDLAAALGRVLDGAPAAADLGRPRLWVDRAFTITGAGTVLTGTLTGGRLRLGDAVEVQPSGARGRVRGLQSLQRPVEEAPPGSRVAVNVAGLERGRITRGAVLGLEGHWRPTTTVEAWVDVLPGREVSRKGAWHLHAGSGDWTAAALPVSGRVLREAGAVRLELDRPAVLVAGDRFVLRDAGRRATVAGGTVLDADPPARTRGRAARGERLHALSARRAALGAGDLAALLEAHVRERGAAPATTAARALGLSSAAAADAAGERGLVDLDGAWAHPDALEAWGRAAQEALAGYHATHPVERAAPKDVALRALGTAGCPAGLEARALDALVARGRLAAEGPGVRTPEHRPHLDERASAARAGLLGALAADLFAPPRLSEAAHAAGASDALVRELEAGGELVRLGPDLAVAAQALDEAVTRLRAAYTAEGPLTAARAKEVLGTSRRVALPLLEHLDRTGRTRRQGDVRVVH